MAPAVVPVHRVGAAMKLIEYSDGSHGYTPEIIEYRCVRPDGTVLWTCRAAEDMDVRYVDHSIVGPYLIEWRVLR